MKVTDEMVEAGAKAAAEADNADWQTLSEVSRDLWRGDVRAALGASLPIIEEEMIARVEGLRVSDSGVEVLDPLVKRLERAYHIAIDDALAAIKEVDEDATYEKPFREKVCPVPEFPGIREEDS